MPDSFIRWLLKAAIIGSALLVAGCSTLRLAYNSAPQLTWWWMDSYLDLSGEQSPPAREALEQWFAWHRQTQLTDYANWLASIEPTLDKPTTPDAVCSLFEQMRLKMRPAFEQAYVLGANLAPHVGPAQIKSLEAKYAKNNAEFRTDYLQMEPAKRRERGIKNAVERFERLYGKLGEAQRAVIAAAAPSSPFDPRLSLADRERRQADVLQLLRRWLAERPSPAQALASLRQVALSAETPPDAAHRQHQERLTQHSCKLTADLHNSTTAAQRSAARKQLKEWEGDLRALAAERRAAAP